MSEKSNTSIAQKTEALNELIAWFHGEEFNLESALEKFKQAEKIASEIEEDLMTLKNEVNIVKQKFEGIGS